MGASSSKRKGGAVRDSNVENVGDDGTNSVAEEMEVGVAKPAVANVGADTGVFVPEFDFRSLSLPKHEPIELLSQLNHYAAAVSVDNANEFDVLKNCLSAFYHFKGCSPLRQYCEPCYIEGLEDKDDKNDQSLFIELPFKGPDSDDKIYRRRKQKSVAELMQDNTNVEPKVLSCSSPKRKRGTDVVEKSGSAGGSSTRKSGRNRKVEVSESPTTSSEKILDAGVEGMGHVNEDPLPGKETRIEVSAAENTSGGASPDSEGVKTPRERKKSKYLSPPFMNPVQRTEKTSCKMKSEIESDKITMITGVGDLMKEVAEHLSASPTPVTQSVDDVTEEKLPGDQLERSASVDANPHTINDDIMILSASDVNVVINEVVSEIQFAALNPLCLINVQSLDVVRDFVCAFRSSTFIHGSNYKIYHKHKTDKKRKSQLPELRNLDSDLAQKNTKSSDLKPCKSVTLKMEGKPGTSQSQKADENPVRRTRARKAGENARLVLTFAPEYPLPSKSHIVKLFSKFGSLNEKEINVMTDSHSVQIVYAKDSDADAAYKSSLSQSPFGSVSVNYRLQPSSIHSGSDSKVSSPPKQTPDNPSFAQPVDELMSEMGAIQQKIEIMAAILENYHPKFRPEDKSSLKDDMKNLMENIEAVNDKVRIIAEKTISQGDQVESEFTGVHDY